MGIYYDDNKIYGIRLYNFIDDIEYVSSGALPMIRENPVA